MDLFGEKDSDAVFAGPNQKYRLKLYRRIEAFVQRIEKQEGERQNG